MKKKSLDSLSEAAFKQLKRDLKLSGREGPGSKNETFHVKHGPRSHFGVGKRGKHLASTVRGHNVHFYKNRIYIVGPDGKGKNVPITTKDKAKVKKLFEMKKAASLLGFRRGFEVTARSYIRSRLH